MIAATADLPTTKAWSSAEVKGLVTSMHDALIDGTTESTVNKMPITSAYFRYTGESRDKSAVEIERLLQEISSGLISPLRLLREQYHKLDREL